MYCLSILIPDWLVFLGVLAILIIGLDFTSTLKRFRKETADSKLKISSLEGLTREKDLQISAIQANIKVEAQNLAKVEFEDWKERELDNHRKVMQEAANDRAKSMLSLWMQDTEKDLRKDAITRSMGVNFGKITEHLLPFSRHLAEFDPRDIRFIGSPVDLMIFSGATAKKSEIDIYLVEIKTGSGQLSKKQKTIRDAIENHRVYWKPIVVPEFQWDVQDDDE